MIGVVFFVLRLHVWQTIGMKILNVNEYFVCLVLLFLLVIVCSLVCWLLLLSQSWFLASCFVAVALPRRDERRGWLSAAGRWSGERGCAERRASCRGKVLLSRFAVFGELIDMNCCYNVYY